MTDPKGSLYTCKYHLNQGMYSSHEIFVITCRYIHVGPCRYYCGHAKLVVLAISSVWGAVEVEALEIQPMYFNLGIYSLLIVVSPYA